MTKTLIGVTTFHFMDKYDLPQYAIGEMYIRSLVRAGATPVMIPLGLDEDTLADLASRLDGVLFPGGGDIHPRNYGGELNPLVGNINEDRDRVELFLMRDVLRAEMPFLGICRGFQVINVALGGSLYEDILTQHPEAMKHDYYPDWSRDYLPHAIEIEPGSHIAGILGDNSLAVNSLHHQGVRQLAPELQATAYAPDGIIEAFELPDYPYGLAVQWHPEWLQEHASMRALFRSFVQAAEDAR